MNRNTKAPHVTIVFMGDSITEGQYVVPELRWTDLVAARIRHAFEPHEGDVHFFFNRGISGETTRQGLERFPRDVQNAHPDVMTLQFGLNDCNCWDSDRGLPRVSPAAYRANLVEMIARARHFGARRIVLSTNHRTLRSRTLANGRTLEDNRIEYNAIVREVAAETGVTLCDIDRDFAAFTTDELARLLLPEPDVLHLSPQGHEYYASLIYPHVLGAVNWCIDNPGRDSRP